MSSINSVNSAANQLRITGMATGLDTDTMVKQMTSVYQAKIDKLGQDKQLVQWKQEEYREIIKDVKQLQEYFDATSDKYILRQSKFNPSSATNSKESVVNVTLGTGVEKGTYGVNVKQLASGASIQGSSISAQFKINDIDNWKGKAISFNVGDPATVSSITLDASISDQNGDGSTSDELVANINNKIGNSDLNGKVLASYVEDSNGGYVKFTNLTSEVLSIKEYDAGSPGTGTTISDINDGNPNGTKINVVNVSSSTKLTDLGYDAEDTIEFKLDYGTTTNLQISIEVGENTINQVLQQINTATNGNVTAKIDSITGKISLKTTETGSSSRLQISGLGVDNSFLGLEDGSQYGQDAIVEITSPGSSTPVTMTQKTNTFTYNDISYTLNSIGESDITVAEDADEVFDNMIEFIDKYNSIVENIQTKLTEKKAYDYKPLTDAQKEEMSDDDIEKWEAKAKQGILKNDSNLQNLLSRMRSAFYDTVYNDKDSDDKISLHLGVNGEGAIGLDTSNTYTEGGKIILDSLSGETLLKDAIKNNSEDFMNLFIKSSDDYDEQGIFQRIDDILRDYVGDPSIGTDGKSTYKGTMNIFVNKQYDFSLSGTSGENTLPDQIYRQEQAIQAMLTKMADKQEKYYQQFATLESAMNNLNSQSNWLYQQLGMA